MTTLVQKILCHIVGIPVFEKDKIVKKLTDKFPEVETIDLEPHIKKLRNNDKELNELNQRLEKSKKAKTRDKTNLYRNKIAEYWKTTVYSLINKLINKTKKQVILLGFTNYHKEYRVNVGLRALIKSFIRIDETKYAKNMVGYNLDHYRKEIMNNTFPWNYLKIDFIKAQREKLLQNYQKLGYSHKSFDTICKSIDLYLKREDAPLANDELRDLYVCLPIRYDGKTLPVDPRTKKIVAYPTDWLAMVSMVQNHSKLKKGYEMDKTALIKEKEWNKSLKPFVQELQAKAINALKTDCHLYKVNRKEFGLDNPDNAYRYVAFDPVKIISRTYVVDIYKKLREKKIKIIRYKNKKAK